MGIFKRRKRIVGGLAGLVLAIGIAAFIMPAQPAAAATGKWLNRAQIVSGNVLYRDTNTYDNNLTYEEVTQKACKNRIAFAEGTHAFDSEDARVDFFYKQGSATTYQGVKKEYITMEQYSPGGGSSTACRIQAREDIALDENIVGGSPARRIIFYKNDKDQIVHLETGILFERAGDFKTIPRYYRKDSKTVNDCKDAILLKNAEPFPAGDAIFGNGSTPGSSILYAVSPSGGRESETYDIITEPNNIGRDSCHPRDQSIDRKRGGEYGLFSSNDGGDGYIDRFTSAGVDESGSIRPGSGDFNDDAFIIFIGTIANVYIPPGSDPNNPVYCKIPGKEGLLITDEKCKEDAKAEQTCRGGAMGWIICPMASGIRGMLELLESLLDTLLSVNPLPQPWQTDVPEERMTVYRISENFRNFANIIFVFLFLVIIFSQATSIGIRNFGLKKMLGPSIAVIILVQVAYPIASVAIDAGNIFGVGIRNLAIAASGGSTTVDVNNLTGIVVTPALIAALAFLFKTGAIVQILPLLAMAGISMLIGVIFLVLRQAFFLFFGGVVSVIVLLLLFENTRRLGMQIIGFFGFALFLYGLIMFFLAFATIAASIITRGASSDTLEGALIQMIGGLLPALSLLGIVFAPKLASQSRSYAGRLLGAAMAGASAPVVNRASEYAKGSGFYQSREYARNQRKARRQERSVASIARRLEESQGRTGALNTVLGRNWLRRAGGRTIEGQQDALQAGVAANREIQDKRAERSRAYLGAIGMTGDRNLEAIAANRTDSAGYVIDKNGSRLINNRGQNMRGITEDMQRGALMQLADAGRDKVLTGLDSSLGSRDVATGRATNEFSRMMDDAVMKYPARIRDKAPHLFPGMQQPEIAFTGVNAETVSKWSDATIKRASQYYEAEAQNGNFAPRDEFIRAYSAAVRMDTSGERIKADALGAASRVFDQAAAGGTGVSTQLDTTAMNEVRRTMVPSAAGQPLPAPVNVTVTNLPSNQYGGPSASGVPVTNLSGGGPNPPSGPTPYIPPATPPAPTVPTGAGGIPGTPTGPVSPSGTPLWVPTSTPRSTRSQTPQGPLPPPGPSAGSAKVTPMSRGTRPKATTSGFDHLVETYGTAGVPLRGENPPPAEPLIIPPSSGTAQPPLNRPTTPNPFKDEDLDEK